MVMIDLKLKLNEKSKTKEIQETSNKKLIRSGTDVLIKTDPVYVGCLSLPGTAGYSCSILVIELRLH